MNKKNGFTAFNYMAFNKTILHTRKNQHNTVGKWSEMQMVSDAC